MHGVNLLQELLLTKKTQEHIKIKKDIKIKTHNSLDSKLNESSETNVESKELKNFLQAMNPRKNFWANDDGQLESANLNSIKKRKKQGNDLEQESDTKEKKLKISDEIHTTEINKKR